MNKKVILSWVKELGIAILIAVLLLQIIRPTIVKEHSMLPTLNENDYLLLSKQSYLFSEPKYGDIIVFKSDLTTENGKQKLLIKRIIAVPGDTIEIANEVVYINGAPIDEPFIKDYPEVGTIIDTQPTLIGEGKFFVMGDNRSGSADSRDPKVGVIDRDRIVGKAVVRLFPFNKITTLKLKDEVEISSQ